MILTASVRNILDTPSYEGSELNADAFDDINNFETFCTHTEVHMKYVNGRLTGLVTFCVETAFYRRLLKVR
jgi:hypothetical protein